MAANPNLIDLYEDAIGERQQFLTNSESIARLTIPEVSDPRYSSRYIVNEANARTAASGDTLFDNAGTQAVAGLASSLQSMIFPNQVDWFKLILPEDLTQQVLSSGVTESDIDNALSIKSKSVKRLLSSMNYQAAVGRILIRLLIEDNVVVVVTKDAIRAIPMRNAAIKRYGGKIGRVFFKEEILDGKTVKTAYTMVDYVNNEVWQQFEGNDTTSRKITKNLKPKQVFVVSSSIPDFGSYVCSYAFRSYGLISSINHYAQQLHRAASIAGMSVMCIDPQANMTPQQVASMKAGQAFVGEASALTWVNSGAKISDWQFVQVYLMELKQQLAKSFALDLLNQGQFAQPRSATEIVAITSAIDSHVASLAQTTQETFAKALVGACLEILRETEDSSDFMKNLNPIVTSGTSTFDATVQYQKLLQGLMTVAQFDPTLAQRIDSLKLLETFAAATGIDTTGYIRELPQQIPQPPVQG